MASSPSTHRIYIRNGPVPVYNGNRKTNYTLKAVIYGEDDDAVIAMADTLLTEIIAREGENPTRFLVLTFGTREFTAIPLVSGARLNPD